MNDSANVFFSEAIKSPFYTQAYTVDICLDDFPACIFTFLNRAKRKEYEAGNCSLTELMSMFNDSIPEFQRSNDKWTREMQSSFVSNVLQGLKPQPLLLYTANAEGRKTNCMLLDGLQRLTALFQFFVKRDLDLKSAISGSVFTAQELHDTNKLDVFLMGIILPVKVYEFKSELEAVNHYIHINENITHSKDDIVRAKRFRNKLLNCDK
ncbi:MAG: DUF262 domain-containing protein [Endozoicomonadaceae bacterium]|nr:DUF262 domain-containing protein [Endozoicomonadaceae bacterium]